ncbi:MAG TPA: TetR-like C-terminal domain-containing protein [Ideonella sp.]|uniref:TetR-like C-terminal domain-containing protein n=1 Tax=Ideonella sp. TaxID=1929293 RepID=UPI002E3015F6|nr:TetR-like C-terminal domain-containing protein [Ideonella sp.]HEX5682793.1 TetR-like C-terminal domain-containing protein [Ideonella sp.]
MAIAKRPAAQHLPLLGQAYLAFARTRPHMYRLMFSSRIVATQPDHAELQPMRSCGRCSCGATRRARTSASKPLAPSMLSSMAATPAGGRHPVAYQLNCRL